MWSITTPTLIPTTRCSHQCQSRQWAGGNVSFSGNVVTFDPLSAYDYLSVDENCGGGGQTTPSAMANGGPPIRPQLNITVTGTNDGPVRVQQPPSIPMRTPQQTVDVVVDDMDVDANGRFVTGHLRRSVPGWDQFLPLEIRSCSIRAPIMTICKLVKRQPSRSITQSATATVEQTRQH